MDSQAVKPPGTFTLAEGKECHRHGLPRRQISDAGFLSPRKRMPGVTKNGGAFTKDTHTERSLRVKIASFGKCTDKGP